MNINRINRQSFMNAYNKSSNKSVKNVSEVKNSDTIEISSLGKSLNNYSMDSSINSAHKVAQIKSQIDSGTYSVDARLTARSILNAMKGE